MATIKVDEERLIKILYDMIKIESQHLILKEKGGIDNRLKELADPYNFEVEMKNIKPGCKNIYITLKGNEPGKTLLYFGHIDTFNVDNMNMTLLLFDAYIEDDKISKSIGFEKEDIKITPMSKTAFRSPMEINDQEPLVFALKDVNDEMVFQSKLCAVDYWTDGFQLSINGIPTEVFGSRNIKEAHASEKFIFINSLFKSAYCYIDLIDKIQGL